MVLIFQIYAMTRRLSAMVKEKRKKIMSDWSSAVQHEKKLTRQMQKNSQGKSVISRYRFIVSSTAQM